MHLPHPAARKISRLSPSGYETILACPLRYAFSRDASSGIGGPRSPAAALGQLAHRVLERAVSCGWLVEPGWEERLQVVWQETCEEEARERWQQAAELWPGYELKRALLRYVAAGIRELIVGLPSDALILTEPLLTSADNLLEGKPDVLIRSEDLVWIIDYKTGRAVEEQSGAPLDSYARQLKLYSYLEHQTSARWPDSAHLFPFDRDPVEVPIKPSECDELAAKAMATMLEYNGLAPKSPPSRCSPEACRFCSFASVCPDFWDLCDESWKDQGVVAAGGPVARVVRTALGGTTIQFEATVGSVGHTAVTVGNLNEAEFSALANVVPGSMVFLAGLSVSKRQLGLYHACLWTRLSVKQ